MGRGHDPALAELGEEELIRRLGAYAPPGQFQDDGAILAARGPLVLNTDVLVEGRHFSDATTEPFDAGWRAAAANLSDLAAMGCTDALGITVGLVAPAQTRWSWVQGVYEGLQACLNAHGAGAILGGDCSGGEQRILALSAVGELATAVGAEAGGDAIRRGDGQPGDVLIASGPHGLSRLGLALLQDTLAPGVRDGLDPDLVDRARAAHRRPRARFDVVRALRASRPAACPWRVGGTDSSDGLAMAVEALATAGGCQAVLQRSALPLDPAMAALDQGVAWCLSGGEDFELVLALAPPWAAALLAALPGSEPLGVMRSSRGNEARVIWQDGSAVKGAEGAYCHFQTSF